MISMTTARATLVDDQMPFAYHLISRCVRRSFLCGKDRATAKDYTHRKHWLIDRLRHLGRYFAVDIYAYSIMSNHFHMVVYYDPKACDRWSCEEVAERWCNVCPVRHRNGDVNDSATANLKAALLLDPETLEQKRRTLGSLSDFMKLLKQPIAYRANQEDGCSGHFFEQRFYSGVLLDEDAMIQAMAYVDLNPVRAKLASHIEEIDHASVSERIKASRNTAQRIDAALRDAIEPIVSGTGNDAGRPLSMSLTSYFTHLETAIRAEVGKPVRTKERAWIEHLHTFKHRQRAYGPLHLLKAWIDQRGLQLRELPTT